MSAHLPLPASSPPKAPPCGLVLAFDPVEPHPDRPRLRCVRPSELNPHVFDAHAHGHAWVVRMRLVGATEASLQRCLSARFAWLAARAYPTVNREELHVVVDWLSFLFFFDDLCDTRAVQDGVYRGDLAALEDRLLAVAHGVSPVSDDDPLVHALADIRRRLARRACEAWLSSFAGRIAEYVDGVRWERVLRLQGHVPSPATYARLRPLNSAVFPCLDLAGMFIDGDDHGFAQSTWLQQLALMANNHVSWVNDVYGIDKEIRERTHANLVVVLASHDGLSWDDALDRAIEACNAELDAFVALSDIARARCDARGRALVDAMASWMRGNLDWYAETARYGL
jgi:5-epi-alpha-selinene synthase